MRHVFIGSKYCGTDYAASVVSATHGGRDHVHLPGGVAGKIDQDKEKEKVKETQAK